MCDDQHTLLLLWAARTDPPVLRPWAYSMSCKASCAAFQYDTVLKLLRWCASSGAHVTADEGIMMLINTVLTVLRSRSLRDDDAPEDYPFVPWMSKYGHRVSHITICSGYMFYDKPLPFMSTLSRLTTLELCCLRMSPEVLSCLAGSMKVCGARQNCCQHIACGCTRSALVAWSNTFGQHSAMKPCCAGLSY
jgi:hypothetical protein